MYTFPLMWLSLLRPNACLQTKIGLAHQYNVVRHLSNKSWESNKGRS